MGGGNRRPGRNLHPPRLRRGRGGATAFAKRSLFVAAGDLIDWNSPSSSTSGAGKTRGGVRRRGKMPDYISRAGGNVFSYAYPVSPADQLVDPTTPSPGGAAVSVPLFDHGPGATALFDGSHRGLGFNAEDDDEEGLEEVDRGERDELKVEDGDEEDEEEERQVEKLEEAEVAEGSKAKKNKKTRRNDESTSIGSLRLYTDVSSPDEDYGDTEASDSDELSLCSDDEEEEVEEAVLEDDELSSSFEDGSEVDQEVAEDHLEGEWLAKQKMGAHHGDGFSDSDESSDDYVDEDGDGKLGGVALKNASREYGMKKLEAKKGKVGVRTVNVGSLDVKRSFDAFDDLMFVKDTRRPSGKKSSAKLSRSWPAEAHRSKKDKNIPGAKKKHRREQIAKKRRERMIDRGVDLDQINSRLRKMVLNEVDTLSFQPMHSRECSQVQRLASIYRLHSGAQGSGKKRFVTVARTQHTSLPSSSDKLRLEKLLGDVDDDFAVNDVALNSKSKAKSDGRLFVSPGSHPSSISAKLKVENGRYKQKMGSVPIAERHVIFVSSGTMQNDSTLMVEDSSGTNVQEEPADGSSTGKIGAFEVHTKGFGSRMMTKMGYVEGSGLGKDGQGMSVPIEPVQRPKLLGLGVQFRETTVETNIVSKSAYSGSVGAFEKHTKAFGSQMMAKMGFVPGTGLGKDAQGMTTPLTAVRRPKSQGLGAKS